MGDRISAEGWVARVFFLAVGVLLLVNGCPWLALLAFWLGRPW